MSAADRELFRRAGELFDELVDRPADARERRLAEVARSEPELAREAAALLAADLGESRALDEAIGRGAVAAVESATPGETYRPGLVIGAWRIVSELGRGGMGEVYLAERADGAYEQRAALKRIRRGAATPELAARFLRERQILARLEHPGIARLIDGGVDPGGSPYLVLEHVAGRPITQFAAERALSGRAIVELLLQACEAVEVAHRALVVHRDLKPPNLLVTDSGEVKLLDFGIAKLLEAKGDPAATHLFLPIYTPAYAAPEQIRGGAIGTATDVYALGVMLYELLAGERPFARAVTTPTELVAELEREAFERPSARLARRALAADGEQRDRLARRSREVAGDLDAILAQALEVDVARRYPTVAAFAGELRRHLAGLPVEARGRGHGYRLRRFVARHRFGVAASVAIAGSVLGGLLFSLVQARLALSEARRAEATQRFLVDMFETVDPSRALGERVSARDLLERGARKLASEVSVEPRTRAALAETLARTYLGLGAAEEAMRWGEEALALHRAADGPESASALGVELLLARIDRYASRLDEAERRLAALGPRLERAVGRESPLAVAAATALAEVQDEAFTGEESGIDRWRTVLERTRRVHGNDSLETALAMGRVADELGESRDFARSEAGLREALAIARRVAGERSPTAIDLAGRLAHVLDVAGKDDEALALYDRLIADARQVFGEEHAVVGEWLSYESALLLERRRLDDAERLLADAERIFRRLRHADLGAVLRRLGEVEMIREQFGTAEERFAAAVEQLRADFGEHHALYWAARVSLASARVKLGRLDGTEALIREAIAKQEELHGADGSIVRQSLKVLADCLRASGRPAEALATRERALAIERELFKTDDHLGVVTSRREIALDLVTVGGAENLRRARSEIDAVVAYFRPRQGEGERLGRALWASARVAIADRDRARAVRELDEAIELLTRALGETAPSSRAARRDRAALAGK